MMQIDSSRPSLSTPAVKGLAVETPQAESTSFVRAWAREMALQDWMVTIYLAVLLSLALMSIGPGHAISVKRTSIMFAISFGALVLVRGKLLTKPWLNAMVYRAAIYGTVQISYFILGDLLPGISPGTLDGQLFRIDQAIFGVEPTLWADQFVNHYTTEWFAFFYFLYFALLASQFWPFLFGSRKNYMFAEFSACVFTVFCIAHLAYFLVPGFGPYRYLAGLYQHELPSGYWFDTVIGMVKSGGAQKDIFPSLHTAGPTAVTLFAFRHRDKKPYKYTWPILAFCVVNIIGATIFLRWHYAVDVFAGLTLAFTCAYVGAWIAKKERLHRLKNKLGHIWPTFSDAPPVDEAWAKRSVGFKEA